MKFSCIKSVPIFLVSEWIGNHVTKPFELHGPIKIISVDVWLENSPIALAQDSPMGAGEICLRAQKSWF